MCFSPEADLVVGAAIVAVGIDAVRHVDARPEWRLVAPLPLLLGAHQMIESLVWWGADGSVPRVIGDVAMWAYLLIALVLLPTLVPALVLSVERSPRHRRIVRGFLLLGVVVSGVLGLRMAVGHPSAAAAGDHIAYSIGLGHAVVWIGLYLAATVGSLLASSLRELRIFGLANLVALPILARLCAEGFVSLWCFYAAIVSAAIAIHLRLAASRGRGSSALA